jgi:hypothetical protein
MTAASLTASGTLASCANNVDAGHAKREENDCRARLPAPYQRCRCLDDPSTGIRAASSFEQMQSRSEGTRPDALRSQAYSIRTVSQSSDTHVPWMQENSSISSAPLSTARIVVAVLERTTASIVLPSR